jgi:hypothetical protein
VSEHRPVVYSEEDECDTCDQPVVFDPVPGEFIHASALETWPTVCIQRRYQ